MANDALVRHCRAAVARWLPARRCICHCTTTTTTATAATATGDAAATATRTGADNAPTHRIHSAACHGRWRLPADGHCHPHLSGRQ
jgi:hypothetical protein